MWRIQIDVKLVSDVGTEQEEEVHFQVEEELPGGIERVDQWEGDVRRIGFGVMRELFKRGIGLLEQKVLSRYVHKGKGCKVVKRGKLGFTLRTVFGKIHFRRHRVYCKTCGQWVTPLNGALGLHDQELGRATLGFRSLVSRCGVDPSYRLAQELIGEVTQDKDVVSVRQVESIVDAEGGRLRRQEEEERRRVSFDVIREIQDHRECGPRVEGKLYVCMDGILVRSSAGKGRWREGKVGLICTDEREPEGNQGRQRVPIKRYVSSVEPSEVFGSRVDAQAIQMGMRDYEEVVVLGDGARWIRQVRRQCFRDSVYILDWDHLDAKVWETMKVVFPEAVRLRKQTKGVLTSYLWAGQTEAALAHLERLQEILGEEGDGQVDRPEALEALETLKIYLRSNREGIIAYGESPQAGEMLASSLVEKAAEVVE